MACQPKHTRDNSLCEGEKKLWAVYKNIPKIKWL